MISTALALQEATKEAVHNELVMSFASDLCQNRDTDIDTFAHKLYQYSSMLSAMTTTLVVNTVLTESQLNDLLNTIQEMQSMGEDAINGN